MSGRLYLFAGGGTGGHLFPGVAVAQCLVEREPDARILFVGSDRPIERDVLATTGFEHRAGPSVSLAGATRHPLRFITRSLTARRESMRLIDAEQPAVVIGCGGFASAAPVYAASRRQIPFVLLEQNVIPGRTTRWLSRLGGTVCLSCGETAAHLPKSATSIVTGNPVRRTIAELWVGDLREDEALDERRTLLVLGGSQGAESVNAKMRAFVRQQRSRDGEDRDVLAGWRIVHQTGAREAAAFRQFYDEQGVEAQVAAFFDDTPGLYRQASLVVSRSGATTLAELACAGLPALLLPYPHAAHNHQWHNAEVFRQAGAAVVVRDGGDETATQAPQPPSATLAWRFDETLLSLLTNVPARQTMSDAMRRLACPDAAASVCDLIAGV